MSRLERGLRAIYDVRFLLIVLIVTTTLAVLIPIKQNRVTNERLLGTVNSIKQQQVVNTDTNTRVRDCVLPEGRCYKENQKRTAAAIQQLEDYTIFTNACVVVVQMQEPEGYEEAERLIRECVAGQIKKGSGR